jgi:hypothetical protein
VTAEKRPMMTSAEIRFIGRSFLLTVYCCGRCGMTPPPPAGVPPGGFA